MTERGILDGPTAAGKFAYSRHEPGPELAPFVEHFWICTWDLTGQPPYVARVLPHPSVNVTAMAAQAHVTGLTRSRYDRTLTDADHVVGARFRPGCFRPFLASAVSSLTDTHRTVRDVFGRDDTALRRAVAAASSRGELVDLLEGFLLAGLPARDPVAEEVAGIVDAIAAQPSLVRVDDLAGRLHTTTRRLQRLFAEYVGAGPKWVIRRCRLQEAAARAAASADLDWAELAAELGYADQAHLTRAFTATIGCSPAAYARTCTHAGSPGR